MRVLAAFLANWAEAHDGLVFVSGGWPEWWSLPEVPSKQDLSLVIVYEVEPDEVGSPFRFDVALVHNDSKGPAAWITATRAPSGEYVSGAPLYGEAIIRFQMEFAEVGVYTFEVDHDGRTVASVALGVRLSPG